MKIKKEKLKPLLYPAAFILIAVLSLAYKLFMNGTGEIFVRTVKGDGAVITSEFPEQSSVESDLTVPDTEPDESTTIQVYVCGAVVSPGVYELPRGVILNDVITCAGGFTDAADITKVNLVYEIDSNVSVFIPEFGQSGETVSAEAFTQQDDIIREEDEYVWGEGTDGQSENNDLININTASKEELMTLPGIGEVYAQSIIDYREAAPFGSIEEIKNVSGIGDAKFEKIKPYITV